MTVLAHPGGHAADGGPPTWAALVVLVATDSLWSGSS
jgi:hypothetical protein